MKRTKQEIEEELNHKQNLIRTYRARLRPLEIQAAQRGLNAPPETLTEISSLTEQIRVQEDEIAKLETLAAEGQLSLAEAEFRLILAEAWDTPIGRPTAAGAARLELARLRLGLSPERAAELEKEVRARLVEEIFSTIDVLPLLGENLDAPGQIGSVQVAFTANESGSIRVDHFEVQQNLTLSSPLESALRLLGKAIRLAPPVALQLFLKSLPDRPRLDLADFKKSLFAQNRVWVNQNEYVVFNNFLVDLSDEYDMNLLPPPQEEESNDGTTTTS